MYLGFQDIGVHIRSNERNQDKSRLIDYSIKNLFLISDDLATEFTWYMSKSIRKTVITLQK